jgi:hypothetical protein
LNEKLQQEEMALSVKERGEISFVFMFIDEHKFPDEGLYKSNIKETTKK